jgi:ubiquinone/menaquinone biosynthesis C-methylase UbiE
MHSVCILDIFRLDLQHYGVQHITKKRYFAPIEEPHHVIDIGAGSGRWILASILMHVNVTS